MREKNNEYRLILACARLKVSGPIQNGICNLLSGALNWDKIIEISIHQEILPFLYYNLSKLNLQNILPKETFSIMENYYYSNTVRNAQLEKEFFLFMESANCEKLSVLPLKGLGLLKSLYSNNPGLRIMVDIDLLIKEDEFKKINNILMRIGYTQNYETFGNKGCSVTVFSKMLTPAGLSVIEIHTQLSPARPYPIKLPRIWKRAREKTVDSQRILLLSEEDAFLSLALHLRRHTRRLSLKFIVDIAELLNANNGMLDWNYIKKSAKDNHIITTVYFALYITEELLNTSVPAKILKQFQPNMVKRLLIRLCINRCNFFTVKKRQGAFLRFLLFDRLLDFLFYLWQVSFLERFLPKRAFNPNRALDRGEYG